MGVASNVKPLRTRDRICLAALLVAAIVPLVLRLRSGDPDKA